MVREERLDTFFTKVCRVVLSLAGANCDFEELEPAALAVVSIVPMATLKVAHYKLSPCLW
jgi:hypothetical protein